MEKIIWRAVGSIIAWIEEPRIPYDTKVQGLGRRVYREWEKNLPNSIEIVQVFAVDNATGNADAFWRGEGFSYMYEGDELTYEQEHTMWKGVNGHPTPGAIRLD